MVVGDENNDGGNANTNTISTTAATTTTTTNAARLPPNRQQQRRQTATADNEGRFAFQSHPLYPSPVQTEFDRPINQDLLQTANAPQQQTAAGNGGGLFGNVGTAAQANAAPELSTVRICCLYNRIKDFGMLDDDDEDQLEDGDGDEHVVDDMQGVQQSQTDPSSSSATPLASSSSQPPDMQHIRPRRQHRNRSPEKKIWPKGLYYRAVKLNPMGTTAALVQGKKYLLITPYTSPLSTMFKRELDQLLGGCAPIAKRRLLGRRILEHNRQLLIDTYRIDGGRSERLLSLLKELAKLEVADSTANNSSDSKQENKRRRRQRMGRDECVQELYPVDRFEKWMVQEDLADGRCGLYELRRVPDINTFNVRALKRRTDSFLICLATDGEDSPEPQTSPAVVDSANEDESVTGPDSLVFNDAEMISVGSSTTAAQEQTNTQTEGQTETQTRLANRPKKSAKHEKNLATLLPCRCELTRLKALMHRQLLCGQLRQRVDSLLSLWSERQSYRPQVEHPASGPADCTANNVAQLQLSPKPPAVRRRSFLDLYAGGWNFLDILNSGGKTASVPEVQPQQAQKITKRLKTFGGDDSIWSTDELPPAPSPPLAAGQFPLDKQLFELGSEVLELRLRLICILRLFSPQPTTALSNAHRNRRIRQAQQTSIPALPTISQPSLSDLLQNHLVSSPPQTDIDLLTLLQSASIEQQFLISESLRSDIDRELERRVQLLLPELSRSQARQRLLRAIKDMLSVMQRNLQNLNPSSSSSSSSSPTSSQPTSSLQSPALESTSRSSSSSSLPPPPPPPRSQPSLPQQQQRNVQPGGTTAAPTNLTMANISSELLAEEDHCKQLSGVLDNYRSAQDIFRRVHRHYNQIYFNSDPSAVTNHSIGMFDLFQWYQQKV